MEKSEQALAPEWLRTNGGGNGGGNHHFPSSQADGPVLALPRRTRSSKSIGTTDSSRSSLLDRSSSSNSRRSLNSNNGSRKHDKDSHGRSYDIFFRGQRDRNRSATDSWDPEYSDPLRGMINGKVEDPLRRSQSLISRKPVEALQQRMPSDMKNGIHNNYHNGNGTHSMGGNLAVIPKVSFERDFPVLGSEDRPKTPDIIRVSSPGLTRGIQSLSFGKPPSVGSEAWTSALAEVPSGPGSNNGVGSSPALQPTTTASASASSSSSVSVPSNTMSGLNMAEALVQAPAHALKSPQPSVQLQREELALAQSKKLIPMTPLLPKTMVLSSSDKLKPKTAMRSNETSVTPKNGLHHLSPLQLGSQLVRGASSRGDGPKSPSSGKLLVLKSGRENGVSPGLKDLQSPTANMVNRVANGQSIASAASGPSKNSHNPKILPGDRKTFGYGLNPVAGAGIRNSRSDFFKLVREKSLNSTSPISSGASGSSDVVDKTVEEAKDLGSAQVTPAEPVSELKCNGDTCTVADSCFQSMEIDTEEERAFLISLGWDSEGADEDGGGLTEEEIYAFVNDARKQGPTSRLFRILQAKVLLHVRCLSSNEPSAPASQAEA